MSFLVDALAFLGPGDLAFVLLAILLGVGAFALRSPLAAALVLAPLGALAAAVGWLRRRRGDARRPAPVYLGVLPAALVLVSGRASALIPFPAPATGRPCVYWRRRVTSAEVSGSVEGGDGVASASSDEDDAGLFLIDDGQGRALVWPDGRMSFAGGWHESLKGVDGFRDLAELVVLEGATVSVVGRAGSLERMFADMGERAAELPPDLLRALQTRADLRGLPCFWPGADDGFRAAEGSPEALLAEVTGRGETLFYAGLLTVGFAAVLFLGAAFGVF